MNLLLDTHALIWYIGGNPKFSPRARAVVETGTGIPFVSLASIWEIAIKTSCGKLRLGLQIGDELRRFLEDNEFVLLGIGFEHVTRVVSLPFYHKDPFDRLLVAQTLVEGLTIVSNDEILDEYGVDRLW